MTASLAGKDIGMHLVGNALEEYKEVAQVISEDPSDVLRELIILFAWVGTWRITVGLGPERARPVLDELHKPVFETLAGGGIEPTTAERLIGSRYDEYNDIVRSYDGGTMMQTLARHFSACCDPQGRYSPTAIGLARIAGYIATMAQAVNSVAIPQVRNL